MAGLRVPLSTLRQKPYDRYRMTRGRGGWLGLPRTTLSFATPCRSPDALRARWITSLTDRLVWRVARTFVESRHACVPPSRPPPRPRHPAALAAAPRTLPPQRPDRPRLLGPRGHLHRLLLRLAAPAAARPYPARRPAAPYPCHLGSATCQRPDRVAPAFRLGPAPACGYRPGLVAAVARP